MYNSQRKNSVTALLANAVKFSPENGEILFEATLFNEENGIITLQIEVAVMDKR